MLRLASAPVAQALVAATLAALLSLTLVWRPAMATAVALELPGDPAIGTLISAEQALLTLTNADRATNGLAPLQFDSEMLQIARQRAATQIDVPKLSHYNADGELAFVKLLESARVTYELAGENLARAFDNDAGVTQRVQVALMNSPMHRHNILERTFSRVAIGAAANSTGQITFAEVYRN